MPPKSTRKSTRNSLAAEQVVTIVEDNDIPVSTLTAKTPFEIRCKTCQNNLGDSSAFFRAIDDLKFLCFEGARNVIIDGNKKEDPSGTYVELSCVKCKCYVGRRYVTAITYPELLSDFSFSADAVDVHHSSSESTSDDMAGSNPAIQPGQPEIVEDITKLKQFCLMLSEGQDTLSSQFEELQKKQQEAEAANSIQQAPAAPESDSSEMSEIKSRLTKLEDVLQTVIENQNRLMAQLEEAKKQPAKRVFQEFAVEIPPMNKAVLRTSKPGTSQPSTPKSTLSHESGESADVTMENGADGGSAKRTKSKAAREEVGADDEDRDGEDTGHASKRTRLGARRSLGRRSERVAASGTDEVTNEDVSILANPADDTPPEPSSSTKRQTRSKK